MSTTAPAIWTRALAIVLVACATAAHAAGKPNILVMGSDTTVTRGGGEIGVVGRDTPVFAQTLEAITAELQREGFTVYDERAVAPAGVNGSRSDAELIGIARSIRQPPIGAAVIFTIFAGTRKLAYTTDVYT